MNETIRIKLRKIGSSIGLLVPKEQLINLNASAGDEIEVAFLRHRTPSEIKELADSGFGIAKEFSSFERDKKSREF